MFQFNTASKKIFDLGGVIININPALTFAELKSRLHPGRNPEQALNQFQKLFNQFEIGAFDRLALLEQINPWLNRQIKYPEFEKIWNKLLLDIPKHRLDCLIKLKEKEEIFLLSNTNEIHIQAINEYLEKSFAVAGLDDLFTQCFLSYELNQRKPDKDIYQTALRNLRGAKEDFVFFDDTAENVEGSIQAGLNAIHVPNENNDKFWSYLSSQ